MKLLVNGEIQQAMNQINAYKPTNNLIIVEQSCLPSGKNWAQNALVD